MNCYDLPFTLEIGGKSYAITNRGDYRVILDCFSALNDEEIPMKFRVLDAMKIFFEDIGGDADDITVYKTFGEHFKEAQQKMNDFFNCNQLVVGYKVDHKLIDWENDAQMVCAAINNVAQTEIRSEPFVHWFTFMGYYISVQESVLSTVVSIRDKLARHKKLEKYEREYVNNNPQYFKTREEIEEEEEFKENLRKNWKKRE